MCRQPKGRRGTILSVTAFAHFVPRRDVNVLRTWPASGFRAIVLLPDSHDTAELGPSCTRSARWCCPLLSLKSSVVTILVFLNLFLLQADRSESRRHRRPLGSGTRHETRTTRRITSHTQRPPRAWTLPLTVPSRPVFPAILRVHEPAALPMSLARSNGSGGPASVVPAGSVANRVAAIVGAAVDALHHERQERRAAGAARQHGHLDLIVAYDVIDPEPQQLPDGNECRNGGNRGQRERNAGVAPGRDRKQATTHGCAKAFEAFRGNSSFLGRVCAIVRLSEARPRGALANKGRISALSITTVSKQVCHPFSFI